MVIFVGIGFDLTSHILKCLCKRQKIESLLEVLLPISIIPNYILTIILVYFIEKSDIGKYYDFLDCQIVKYNFFKKIVDIDKLRQVNFAFVIFNIIG